MAAGAASAANNLYIASNDEFANVALFNVTGSQNALAVTQNHRSGLGSNRLAITITGDLNGGPLSSTFAPTLAATGLRPGEIVQDGFANNASLEIDGHDNTFAISQVGSGNTLTASIVGNSNQAAIAQYGSGNSVTFTQNGFGNMLSVVQRSW
jgi:hypothetical protein